MCREPPVQKVPRSNSFVATFGKTLVSFSGGTYVSKEFLKNHSSKDKRTDELSSEAVVSLGPLSTEVGERTSSALTFTGSRSPEEVKPEANIGTEGLIWPDFDRLVFLFSNT